MNTALRNRDGRAQAAVATAKPRGVAVTTPHGRALTFGVSRDRTERLMATLAQSKGQELMAAMQARKAARLQGGADRAQ